MSVSVCVVLYLCYCICLLLGVAVFGAVVASFGLLEEGCVLQEVRRSVCCLSVICRVCCVLHIYILAGLLRSCVAWEVTCAVSVLWRVLNGLCRHVGHSNYALSSPSHVVSRQACELCQVCVHFGYYSGGQVPYFAEYLLKPKERAAVTQQCPFHPRVPVTHCTSTGG